ncbi:interleukin-12 receptor subunit beta-2-like [Eucyclogobius newberryi]
MSTLHRAAHVTMIMKLLLSILTALLQTCTGDKSCKIWSSAGHVVQRTSTFRVYCTFNVECRPSMYAGHPPKPQEHQKHNSTTIYLDVVSLTEGRTFSCDCDDIKSNTDDKPDSCGLDISAGYPPDLPTTFSCVYHISFAVVCSWASGQETYIRNDQQLWVRTFTHNASGGSKSFRVSAEGSPSARARFTLDSSVQVISVRARVTNKLGSAETPETNYTLSDIMMPSAPVLHQVDCSSRNCSVKLKQSPSTHHLDINYKVEDDAHWTHPHWVVANGSALVQSLLPYKPHHFRARSRFKTGLWSDWSRTVSRWTQEEAPARALDTWYAVEDRSMRVYWKKLEVSAARGNILNYIITSQNSTFRPNASSDKQNYPVPFCLNCDITVSACNKRGCSPPANITIHTAKTKPLLVSVINNHNVTISWRQGVSAPLPLEHVIEWFPKGQKLDELQWLRLDPNISHFVIKDMEPFVCYDGAVYVFNKNSVERLEFTDINTAVMVPTAGPSVEEKLEGTTVTVTWPELHISQRGGCITKYTVYLKESSSEKAYNVSASQRSLVLRDLTPGSHSIWITASTAKGESQPGQKVNFFIQQDSEMVLIVTLALVFILLMFILCAYQMSAVKERILVHFQFCLPDIPDPANSKWAKDCLKEKGKVNLQLQLSTSTVSEEDLVFVDIQELPRPLLLPQTSLSLDSESSTPLYPRSTYIKSFSHDSDSSGHTQTCSLDTNETDYISSHGTSDMLEVGEDDEDLPTFPSHSFFQEPLDFGPKLTLDAVRIDGTDFFSLVIDQ